MQLHTSLHHAKAAMTPITAVEVDPAFSNGGGSLVEDAKLGLQCPLRHCGTWHHQLGRHIGKSHPEIGVAKFRKALGIPETASLISHALAAKWTNQPGRRKIPQPSTVQRQQAAETVRVTLASLGAANLKDRCPAQLAERLQKLAAQVGHSPTFKEGAVAWGAALMSWIVRHHKSWNAFKTEAGAAIQKRGGQVKVTLDTVLDVLARFAQANGDLPTYDQAAAANQTAPETILRVLGQTEWPVAMRNAARILGLQESRYLPQERIRRRCEACDQLTIGSRCTHCGAVWERAG